MLRLLPDAMRCEHHDETEHKGKSARHLPFSRNHDLLQYHCVVLHNLTQSTPFFAPDSFHALGVVLSLGDMCKKVYPQLYILVGVRSNKVSSKVF